MKLTDLIARLFTQPVSPDNFRMAPHFIDREPLLENLHQAARSTYHYEQLKTEYTQLIDYLRDGSVPAPVFKYGFYGDDLHRDYWKLLAPDPHRWDEFDERVLTFGFGPNTSDYLSASFYTKWLVDWLNTGPDRSQIDGLVTRLAIVEDEQSVWINALLGLSLRYRPDSAIAQWVLARVERFHTANMTAIQKHGPLQYLHLLLQRKPAFAQKHLPDFLALTADYYGKLSLHEDVVRLLLEHDGAYYAPAIATQWAQVTDPGNYRTVQVLLAKHRPGQYQADTPEAARHYLDWLRSRMLASPAYHLLTSWETPSPREPQQLTVLILFGRLLDADPTRARDYIYHWLGDCTRPTASIYTWLTDRLGADSVPYLLQGLKLVQQGSSYEVNDVTETLFRLMGRFPESGHLPQFWPLTRHKARLTRQLAAVTLAKLGDAAIPEAGKLLTDKKADFRQTGALILSLIKSDAALDLLRTALDDERNDDARDLMLDSLTGLLPVPTTSDELKTAVQGAKKRGKIDAPVFSFLPEADLPPLHWQPTGEPLDGDTLRFLLYRQSRAKDIRPDSEARPLLAMIDRTRSADWAGAVLKRYIDSGADARGKACLTLAGMLGGEAETYVLRAKVTQWADGSRGKMAEYAVQALALIGTNKALRAVEFFTRKYKSKNKNIGAAAEEAFTIAADTLGLAPYDLADSIIPDFGFDGLFRAFAVDNDPWRAFIGTDFKLAFLNEDNKLSKTVPKATSTEIKAEFKEIGQEVRAIVKAQSGRLEQYLVIQRRWPVAGWQSFFMGNPIMFAYTVRLIWGVFDAGQTLLFSFQCQEDQTLLNESGDEIDLTDPERVPDGATVGMVHPLGLSAAQLAYWSGQLADAGLEPIFPQLTRRVVTLPDTDRNLTIDPQFAGVEYGGYGFVGKLDKLGWHRGSVQDAGSIASFYKDFSELGLTAVIGQNGILCVGYYDENAELGNLLFVRTGSIRFGNYMYDDPTKPDDPRLVPMGQVPPIVYSEVLADLLFFRENDQKKTTTQPKP